MLKKITLISVVLMLGGCGGTSQSAGTSNAEKATPQTQGQKSHLKGEDYSQRRAHGQRDTAAREARFRAAAKTLGVSEQRLKEVLRSSRDKPRNWDEIGVELGVDGDAVRSALGRPNRSSQ